MTNFESLAAKYDQWFKGDAGSYADSMEKRLIIKLLQPQKGQSLLDIGCGTGHYLFFFKELGLKVKGIDSSESMLEVARKKLGSEWELHSGKAELLPFSNHSFDIISLITSLEFVSDPVRALREAARVARRKIVLGVLNKHSILGWQRRFVGLFKQTIYKPARFYHIRELKNLIKQTMDYSNLNWESVLFFPHKWPKFLRKFERFFSFRKNPFGAFLCLVVELK